MRERKFNVKFVPVLGLIIPLLLTSCLDDPEPAPVDAMVDVYVKKIMDEGEVKMAPVFWALGNKELQSVTVTGPEDRSWTMVKDNTSGRVFNWFPELEDYTDTIPATGTYTFTVSSTQAEEQSITVTDELGETLLSIPAIVSAQFEEGSLTTIWEETNNAQSYLVRLFDSEDRLVFIGPQMDDTETQFSFSAGSHGWSETGNIAVTGETYNLEVLAILYESGATVNQENNIQCISIGSTDIVWGE